MVLGCGAPVSVRIGILWPQTGGVWTAGAIYNENLLRSLALARSPRFEIVVIEPHAGEYAASYRQRFPDVASVSLAPPAKPTALQRLTSRLRNQPVPVVDSVARTLQSARIDVVFGDLGQDAVQEVPSVGWIPDFQHLHFPEFFPADEVQGRNVAYRDCVERSALLMLSSRDCERDFITFAPEWASKARVASFASLLPDEVFDRDPEDVRRSLDIPRPYALVPNQWWRHKNHETALRAAQLVKEAGSPLTWVFTGALADYRDPEYPQRMLALIDELGLGSVVNVLGVLPRVDQVQLLRDADLIVHPSLFEGWSTVVEDAKTLGQRMVLSDLEVHREQEPPNALFFERLSADSLANAVLEMLTGGVERTDEAEARAATLERARVFGERFASICMEAAGRR